jgi:hypothetical protein
MRNSFLLAAGSVLLLATLARGQARSAHLLTPRSGPSELTEPAPVIPATLTVPADTEASVTMLSGVHSQVSHVDDPVAAELVNPVYVNGRVALPSGTLLDGRITHIRVAGHLHHPAELSFRFDRVTLPDGQSGPISAVLSALEVPGSSGIHLDSEGVIRGSRGYSWKVLTAGSVGLGAFSAVRASIAGAMALKTVIPAGGAAFMTFEVLWPRGKEINLPPQTRCRIRLDNPLTVRIPW